MGGAQRAVRVERPAVALLVPGEPRTASVGDGISLGAGVEVPLLHRMSPRARAIALDWWEAGYSEGVLAGRQQADDEQRGRGAISAAIAAQVARLGPADELEERRGRPEHAARLRQIMAERGI